MIGIYHRLTEDMLRWLNNHPSDADLVVMLAQQIAQAKELYAEVILDKSQAETWIASAPTSDG
jgi:hypothetical protein